MLQGLEIKLGEQLTGWVAANQQPIINSEATLDLGAEASLCRPELLPGVAARRRRPAGRGAVALRRRGVQGRAGADAAIRDAAPRRRCSWRSSAAPTAAPRRRRKSAACASSPAASAARAASSPLQSPRAAPSRRRDRRRRSPPGDSGSTPSSGRRRSPNRHPCTVPSGLTRAATAAHPRLMIGSKVARSIQPSARRAPAPRSSSRSRSVRDNSWARRRPAASCRRRTGCFASALDVLAIDLEHARAIGPVGGQVGERFGDAEQREAIAAAPRVRTVDRVNEECRRAAAASPAYESAAVPTDRGVRAVVDARQHRARHEHVVGPAGGEADHLVGRLRQDERRDLLRERVSGSLPIVAPRRRRPARRPGWSGDTARRSPASAR